MSAVWMIYGANGYTGRLIAEEAKKCGLSPILAGRNGDAVSRMGNRLNLTTRVFSLDRVEAVADNLRGVDVVLHCAGPFSATSAPMLAGCVRAGTHYLDITGEIDVFERCHMRHEEWVEAGIAVIPGVGMDVVPTDCLAVMLKEALPEARRLVLGVRSRGTTISPGTAKTMVEGLGDGCRIREAGELVSIPMASKTRTIAFARAPEPAVIMPWGDVATAYYSTGIPNVEVYFGMPERAIRRMRLASRFGWVAKLGVVQSLLKKVVTMKIQGPSDEERKTGEVLLYGEVTDEAGAPVVKRLRIPEGYTFTVRSALAAVSKVLDGVDVGYATPGQAFGAGFVLGIEGVEDFSLGT